MRKKGIIQQCYDTVYSKIDDLEETIGNLEERLVDLENQLEDDWTEVPISFCSVRQLPTIKGKLSALAEFLEVNFDYNPSGITATSRQQENISSDSTSTKRTYKKSKQQLAKEQSLRMKKYWAKLKEKENK